MGVVGGSRSLDRDAWIPSNCARFWRSLPLRSCSSAAENASRHLWTCLVNHFDDGFNKADRPYYKNALLPTGTQNFAIGASWQCGFFGAAWYLIAYSILAAWC